MNRITALATATEDLHNYIFIGLLVKDKFASESKPRLRRACPRLHAQRMKVEEAAQTKNYTSSPTR